MLRKTEVRAIAEQKQLAVASKKDSQGICFVGSVGIREFLGNYVSVTPGEIIEKETRRVIGYHEGAIFYTIGQRHGLNVGGGLPYYVVAKDMANNHVIVSRNLDDEAMWRRDVTLTDIHWINDPPAEGDRLYARLRHRGALLPCQLHADSLQLSEPERAATAGQSAVIYREDEVLGGGIIA